MTSRAPGSPWSTANRLGASGVALHTLLAAGFTMVACSSQPQPPPQSDVAAGTDTVGALYVFGGEVNTVQPCGSPDELWVRGTPDMMSDLRQRYMTWSRQTQSEPYAPVFVRLLGHRMDEQREGFPEAYDGSFWIDSLVAFSSTGPPDFSSRECETP